MIGKKKFKCLGCSWFKKRLSGRKKCALHRHPDTCGITTNPPDFPIILGDGHSIPDKLDIDDLVLGNGEDLDEG